MLQSPKGDTEILYPSGNPVLTITGDITYTSRQSNYSHIVIVPGAKLTINNILNMFGRVTIYISSGGQLAINGGVVTNAEISMSSGSLLTINNGGKIVMRTNTNFQVPIGAIVNILNGEIISSNDF